MDKKVLFPDEKSKLVESTKNGSVAAINGVGDGVTVAKDTISRIVADVIKANHQAG